MNRRQVWLAAGLLALGLAQMVGHLAHLPALRGLAAATGASPAPKVFSAVQGLETYSTAFYLDWTDVDGRQSSTRITPEMYRRLSGPYNRRNVYGAVLAFGPVMASNPATAPMFRSVLASTLCGDRAILRELGMDPARMTRVQVRLEPLRPEALGGLPRLFEPECRR
jgi:hypothetical protein